MRQLAYPTFAFLWVAFSAVGSAEAQENDPFLLAIE